jgi:heavy metal efflux system protein
MAPVGGIFAPAVSGTAFSISAAIGLIAPFGIAAMDGMIVIAYYNLQVGEGMDRGAAVRRTAEIQMRPVLMICLVACVGLLSAAVSAGIGSQVHKTLAIVVVGGILLAPLLIPLVLPASIDRVSRRQPPARQPVSGD